MSALIHTAIRPPSAVRSPPFRARPAFAYGKRLAVDGVHSRWR
jgi:hypothetical protein